MAARLAGLGMVKCLAFSTNGRLLALGGDDGAITVLDWPSLHARADLRCASPLKRPAFVLGSCLVWSAPPNQYFIYRTRSQNTRG